LQPPVYDYTTDTIIAGPALRNYFNNYYEKKVLLTAKIADELRLQAASAATTANWGGVTGAGKPEDGATRNEPGGIHNSALAYLKGTFVRNAGGSVTYISKTAVPAGVALTNTVYWDEFVTGGGGAAGADARDYLVQPMIIAVETDATGNSGVFPRSAQLKYYDGTVDKTATGQVIYTVVGAPAWATVNAVGAISITEFGAAIEVQFDASYAGQTRRVTLALVKQKTGLPGGTAKAIDLVADRSVLKFNSSDQPTPASQLTSFIVSKQNTTAAVAWSAVRLDGVVINPVTDLLSAATGDSVTMSEAAFIAQLGGTSGYLITASATDGSVLRDTATVVKVRDGGAGPIGPSGTGGALATDDTLAGFSGSAEVVVGAVVITATSNSVSVSAGLSYFSQSGTGTPVFKIVAVTATQTIIIVAFTAGEPVGLGEPGFAELPLTALATGISTGRTEQWTIQLIARRSISGGGNLAAAFNSGSLVVRY
jgi:hypothetical protein